MTTHAETFAEGLVVDCEGGGWVEEGFADVGGEGGDVEGWYQICGGVEMGEDGWKVGGGGLCVGVGVVGWREGLESGFEGVGGYGG